MVSLKLRYETNSISRSVHGRNAAKRSRGRLKMNFGLSNREVTGDLDKRTRGNISQRVPGRIQSVYGLLYYSLKMVSKE